MDKLTFSVDYINVLQNDDDYMVVQLDLLHIGKNRNNCILTEEAVKDAIPSIYNKYIIYRENPDDPDDVGEHNRSETDTTMNICGHIVSGAKTEFVERDGRTYLRVEGVISTLYQPHIRDIIQSRGDNVKVSVEIKLLDKHIDKDGTCVVDKFALMGVCLLGAQYLEGIEGSCLNVLKYSLADADSYYKKFSSSPVGGKTSMGITELLESIRKYMSQFKYEQDNSEWNRYWVREVYTDTSDVVFFDEIDGKTYRATYEVNDGVVSVNVDSRELVVLKYESVGVMYNTVVFASEEYGTGKALKIDKSANALSNDPWGDVDKTKLRKDILLAKNYKTCVNDAYLLVLDNWETAPSSNLKYPVMEIKDGTLVYNRYALASAWAYASAENEQEVVRKVKSLYKKLKIEEDTDMEKNKLDKDNKEIEEIRDDVDADEDDKKEELKKKGKMDNAVIDKPAEEKLRDDEEADKDYWKKKHDELNQKFVSQGEELAKCKAELEKMKKKEFCAKYAHMFKDDAERDDMIGKMSLDELTDTIKNRALEGSFAVSKNSADFPVKYFKLESEDTESQSFVQKYSK